MLDTSDTDDPPVAGRHFFMTTYVAPGSDRFEAVFRLRTITGNACWAIRSSDAASLVLYDDPVQTVPKRIFLSLR